MKTEIPVDLCRKRAWWVLALVGISWCSAGPSGPIPQVADQSEADLAPYRSARPYTEWTTSELIATIPELKAIKAAPSPEAGEKELYVILGRVGESVQEFVDGFPDTMSIEQIALERLGPGGSVEESRNETFRYLMVSHHRQNITALEEYRTTVGGSAALSSAVAGGLMVTKGFASEAIHFHPSLRSDSSFRLIGRTILDGKETVVVAFAQRPGWARFTGRLRIDGRSVLILIQGLAWIDPTNYQIVFLRTDLLAPRTDIGLKGTITRITFGKIHFPEVSKTLWLPSEVSVTSEYNGKTYRNIHHYSDYKIFGSTTKLKF